ncbi:MAG: tRNA (cytidine32/uridine32-2'-O)-methyltransferase [Myxococcota bacterium]|jgi:tRNA (cytidine32/uridine32-2'-O)-methyltransferase
MASPLDRVVVILVQPLYPGNVGATARAMLNNGLSNLIVVDPLAFDAERARWMAPGAHDILANARFVADLDTALDGVQYAVASTARHRKDGQSILSPRQVAEKVCTAGPDVTTAILFGREDHGLDTASVQRCESIVRIPTAEHASLNLSQAVLLIAHELFQAAREQGLSAPGRPIGGHHMTRSTRALDRKSKRTPADLPMLEATVGDWVRLMENVGYTRSTPSDRVATTARALLQRMTPSVREAGALRGMVNRIEWALAHPDIDPTTTRRTRARSDES